MEFLTFANFAPVMQRDADVDHDWQGILLGAERLPTNSRASFVFIGKSIAGNERDTRTIFS